jgi:hypothetical protein
MDLHEKLAVQQVTKVTRQDNDCSGGVFDESNWEPAQLAERSLMASLSVRTARSPRGGAPQTAAGERLSSAGGIGTSVLGAKPGER